jgi:nucleolar protein 4
MEENNKSGQSKEEKLIYGTKEEKKGRVFLKNLPFSVTEEKLKSLFSKYGEINEINLPKKETGELKGFGFINFITKIDAMKAINNMNGKKFDGRKISLTLALSKNDYKNQPKEVKESTKESFGSNRNNEKRREFKKKRNTEEKKEVVNDPKRTLFIRNLGFNTTEDTLKEFFETNYGEVEYVKIVKNKLTNTSKGSGFVMFKQVRDLENCLEVYNKFNNDSTHARRGEETINPFEVDGRNLKLFQSLSKEEANGLEETKEKGKNEDKRKRHLLYYGLNNVKDFTTEEQISNEDMERRERLIRLKKTNFTKNPNYHVSETRVSIRNLDKHTDEEKLRQIVKEAIDKFLNTLTDKEMKKKYNKVKKIKQIKILRDKNIVNQDNVNKSKSVAFVEVCDETIAKALINNLSNYIHKNKGLILDFALDDIRKVQKRKAKMEALKERKENDNKENKHPKREKKINKEPKSQDKTKEKGDSIDSITDVEKLVEIYKQTVSRGKKQRIKKKLNKMGYRKELPSNEKKNRGNKMPSLPKNLDSSLTNKNNFYSTMKIENGKSININKKTKEENKNQGGKDNLLKTKRNREKPKITTKRKHSVEYESSEGDEDMNPMYSQILENLKKNK